MSCEIDVDYDGDNPEFYKDQIQIADEPLTCNECSGTIEIWDKYEKVTGQWDGKVGIYKTCLDCISIRNAFFCNYIHGTIWEELDSFIYHDRDKFPYHKLEELTPKARTMVVELLDEEIECYNLENDD